MACLDGPRILRRRLSPAGCLVDKEIALLTNADMATEILPGVYVGDEWTAQSSQFFQDFEICAVVNCVPDLPCFFQKQEKAPDYYQIPVEDNDSPSNLKIMEEHLPKAVQFIFAADPGADRGVLIHCHLGVSRSCTVGAGLVKSMFKISTQEAVNGLYLQTCSKDSGSQRTTLLFYKDPQTELIIKSRDPPICI